MPLIFPQAFPLVAGSKLPAVKWSQASACRPSDGFGPEDTYGLPTGPRNGIWVLDLDRKDGKDGLIEFMTYADGRRLANTYTVRTPTGGFHLYFRWDDARPVGNRAGILTGVDVRGTGGYVCAGGPYTVEDPSPIADAPEWLLDFVCTREEGGEPGESAVAISPEHPEFQHRIELATRFLAGEPACISGQGGQAQLWKIALRLSRTYELPVATALEVLEPYNARCLPAWETWEMQRALVRAGEIGQGPTGTFSADFLASSAEKAPAPRIAATGEWRKRPDPAHEYTFNLAESVAGGGDKTSPASAKELAAVFTGPAASPEWLGVWQFDVFRRRTVAVNPPFKLDAEEIGLTERDLAKIRVWLACRGVKAATDAVAEAIDVATSCAEFHPVRDYLDDLPRPSFAEAEAYFEGIATRMWGAHPERCALESGHLRRLAIAAVRRVRQPGTKVDNMLILAGLQGYRKSALCAHLFGKYFRDQMPALDNRDASISLEGYWGVEMAEMIAFSRAQEAVKKDFITRSTDKFIPRYGRGSIEVPRQCVFIGTTNEDDFLSDPTGDTRYDVIEVRAPIDLSWSRDGFWAAASVLEAAGVSHFRDRAEASAEKSAETARHAAEDPWTSAVLRYAASNPSKDGWVTAAQCLTYGVPVAAERQDKAHLLRVRNILRRACGASTVRWVEARSQRSYPVPSSAGANVTGAAPASV